MVIKIKGAREHNLKDIDVEIKDGITVVTGISGSGKSSLVFSTLYHESKRRFLNIFSRSSSSRLNPAKVKEITGLGPAVAIEQNVLNRNPLSTLASASGIHPFLRLLYAKFGEFHCPKCDTKLNIYSDDEILDSLKSFAKKEKYTLFAPMLRKVKGSHKTLLDLLKKEFGDENVFLDGKNTSQFDKNGLKPHDLDIKIGSIDKSSTTKEIRGYLEKVKALGSSTVIIRSANLERIFSRSNSCFNCGTWHEDLKPLHFRMACNICKGIGCNICNNTGLYPLTANVYWNGLRFSELLSLSVSETFLLMKESELPITAKRLKQEICKRLKALSTVGLGYLNLNRISPSLSRGESQRVKLSLALTSRLEDMLHILDEPTIGLSIFDTKKFLPAFRDLPGSVVFVEHDRISVASADRAIDLGPGAGPNGGDVIFSGTIAELWESNTISGRYFSKKEKVEIPESRNPPEEFFEFKGVNLRNLKNINVRIPLNRLTIITGVSGSGKSTLIEDVIFPSLSKNKAIGCKTVVGSQLKPVLVDQSPIGKNPRSNPATYTKIAAIIRDIFSSLTELSPSYFTFNRSEGACSNCKGIGSVEVKMRYLPSTWITCSACNGNRFNEKTLAAKVKFGENLMSIADFYRLTVNETLKLISETKLKDISSSKKNKLKKILDALSMVGLGYLQIGQPSPTLSGGESQRVKLAKYLGKTSLETNLLILDEPTTGLHLFDEEKLLFVLDKMVRAGATIVIVEHNSDFIRAADWVIDLGPGAGPKGGDLIFSGPPWDLLKEKKSITGKALNEEEKFKPISGVKEKKRNQSNYLVIQNAHANNLKNINVKFKKSSFNVVTGLSGSGKSSLIKNVLENEAKRRFLETLTLYERQGISEGPEAPVDEITGLGVAISVEPGKKFFNYRSTIGKQTEISQNLAIILSWFGEHTCHNCGQVSVKTDNNYYCIKCEIKTPIYKPKYYSPSTYTAACPKCSGIGSIIEPVPEKLIINPEKPLCKGAMYSPGFFPKGYLCKPFNGGYYIIQALANKYNFDTEQTPWNSMSLEAQNAFLFGDPEPMEVRFESRNQSSYTRKLTFHGFYGWLRDWDVGGTYSKAVKCEKCNGTRLKKEYLRVSLKGYNIHELKNMPLRNLLLVLESLDISKIEKHFTGFTLKKCLKRLKFLNQVGLGYLNLYRITGTLSAGEAQRIKLAQLLGSGLTSLTLLLDEPTRGLHPIEVDSLIKVLFGLKNEGNTIIVVEHDPQVIRAADYIVDMGPGTGINGGRIVANGTIKNI